MIRILRRVRLRRNIRDMNKEKNKRSKEKRTL
jgi:hypothetical protein